MATSLVGKQIGNYKITKLLGEGGMGAVYLGEHPLIGKKVAVKVLHDELALKEDIVSRFFTEAKAVNDIGHMNIVDVVDFGKMKDDAGADVVYFIMEFLEGEALSDRLKKGGLTQQQALHVIAQSANALAASHAKGIVHRDLKPDNIYLVRRGNDDCFAKLLDFGIAKLTGTAEQQMHKTRAGSVLGTPAYMSPEQCDGRGNIDHRSDVYSLGMVLYEMLAGRVAFVGEGFGEILVAQLTLPPPPPSSFNPSIPPEVEAVVLKCLEKDREHRYQSMDELREAVEALGGKRPITSLNKIIEEEAPLARQPTMLGAPSRPTTLSGSAGEATVVPQGPAAPPSSKMPIVLGVLFVLIAGGGVGGYFYLTKKPPPPVVVVQQPPPVEYVHVLIDSTPQGAKVIRAGVPNPIGNTPTNLTLKKGEPAFDVVVQLDGHKSVTRNISTDRDRDVLVALEKEAAPPPAVTPPTTPPATPAAATEKPKKGGGGSRHLPSLPGAPPVDDDFAPLPDKPSKPRVDPDGVLQPSL